MKKNIYKIIIPIILFIVISVAVGYAAFSATITVNNNTVQAQAPNITLVTFSNPTCGSVVSNNWNISSVQLSSNTKTVTCQVTATNSSDYVAYFNGLKTTPTEKTKISCSLSSGESSTTSNLSSFCSGVSLKAYFDSTLLTTITNSTSNNVSANSSLTVPAHSSKTLKVVISETSTLDAGVDISIPSLLYSFTSIQPA